MGHWMQADIHRTVIEALAELAKPHADLCCLNLEVLMRNGYYAEHTIQYEDIRIALLIGENLIEFYGGDGALLKMAIVDKDRSHKRRAA